MTQVQMTVIQNALFQALLLASSQTLLGAGEGGRENKGVNEVLTPSSTSATVSISYARINIATVKRDLNTTDLEDWSLCAPQAVISQHHPLGEFQMKGSSRLFSPARTCSEPFPDKMRGNILIIHEAV